MCDVIDEPGAGEGLTKPFDTGLIIRAVIADDLLGNTGFLNSILQLFVNDIPATGLNCPAIDHRHTSVALFCIAPPCRLHPVLA